jgi:hypothetical protein
MGTLVLAIRRDGYALRTLRLDLSQCTNLRSRRDELGH